MADFGLSLPADKLIDNTNFFTRWYRAPEVFTGFDYHFDGKSADVWAVGCMLYEFYTGRVFMRASSDKQQYYGLLSYFNQ